MRIMVAASIAYLIVLLAFIVWRFVFDAEHRRQLVEEMAARQQREIKHLGGVGVVVIDGGRFDNCSQGVDPFEGKDCATTYLRRIVALTGASQNGGTFVLDVGTTRFYVRDRHVRRLRNVTDPTCEYEETCFNVPHTDMPTAEQIATVLLELTNNPTLFDGWAAQIGAIRADGRVFDP